MLLGIRRIYEKASMTDGRRILVDGLWPRGVRKSTSNIDLWLKDIAPSEELRKWFNHNPKRWVAFKKRYIMEIKDSNALKGLAERALIEDITLVYAASDERRNNAAALSSILKVEMAKLEKKRRMEISKEGPIRMRESSMVASF